MVIAIICDHLQRIVNLADNNKLHIHSRAVTIKTAAQYQSIGAAVQDDVRTLIKADTEREGGRPCPINGKHFPQQRS